MNGQCLHKRIRTSVLRPIAPALRGSIVHPGVLPRVGDTILACFAGLVRRPHVRKLVVSPASPVVEPNDQKARNTPLANAAFDFPCTPHVLRPSVYPVFFAFWRM